MCGIVVVVARPGRFAEVDVSRAVRAMQHRGPDAAGVASVHRGREWEVFFGHARLAIVDLSPAGRQPMIRDGRGAIVFNGEIYDHADVWRALAPRDWERRSRSDTEVLLATALDDPERSLRASNGMLAMGLYDAARERLVLARDRLGKKPLFVYRGPDVLAAASELKAFEALGLPLTLDEAALAEFRWLSYVPGPRSIWREVHKHEPASFSTVDLRAPALALSPPKLFWDPLGGFATPFRGTYDDARAELARLVDDATRIRLEADVPVGVFLSGGIDSSLVAASVAAQHGRRVRAFVVQPDDPRLDESARAKRTAEVLGLECDVLPLRTSRYAELLDRVPEHFDEPHATSSALAVMAMSEAARAHVTVVLTGDGGDEVFLGYPWIDYPRRLALARQLMRAPLAPRLARALTGPRSARALSRLVAAAGLDPRSTRKKLLVLAELGKTRHARDVYELFASTRLRSMLSASDRARLDPRPWFDQVRAAHPDYGWDAAIARGTMASLSALDTVTYLRDDVLQKVDRATMAFSLEARSPLLDHRIVHFGQSLPIEFKAHRGVFKRILRDLAIERVDAALGALPKRGFGIAEPSDTPPGETPIERWCALTEKRWMARWQPARSTPSSR